jgi:hypothetical protein
MLKHAIRASLGPPALRLTPPIPMPARTALFNVCRTLRTWYSTRLGTESKVVQAGSRDETEAHKLATLFVSQSPGSSHTIPRREAASRTLTGLDR